MQLIPPDACGMVFTTPMGHVVFVTTLALIGFYGLWIGTRHYGWWGLMPNLNTELPSRSAEDEALGCILAEPKRPRSPEMEFLAGRAALRRLGGA